jgi:hypothetical protein
MELRNYTTLVPLRTTVRRARDIPHAAQALGRFEEHRRYDVERRAHKGQVDPAQVPEHLTTERAAA